MTQWETVIGLEVHAQLKTHSKIFSGASTQFGALPNTQACAVDLGMPGVLPVLNKAAVEMALKFGLSIQAKIPPYSIFARKNYFYPDLPKGYQISQHAHPIVSEGCIDIILENGELKPIRITRAHLEEDAGKSLHESFYGATGIDLNRSGTALLEIVSEPDMRTAKEAVTYLKSLHALLLYLDICDGNLQEGSFRCDVNVSVRPMGQSAYGTRTELKNINSFRFVERAILYEAQRHIEVIESGGKITQETRLYDAAKNTTRAMRSKEEAHDYRYFPDPDLLPVMIDDALLDSVRATLPELPQQKRERFMHDYELSLYDASVLISDKALADYYEVVVRYVPQHAKLAANWITSELLGALNKADLEIATSPISADTLGQLLHRITDNTISGKIAKTVFEALWQNEGTVDHIIEAKGLKQVTDSGAIEKLVDDIIAAHPEQLAQYRSGKDKLFAFFVGQAMKASQGKVNPEQLNELLKTKLA